MKFLKHFIVGVLCSIPLIPAFSFADNEADSIQNFVQDNFIAFYVYCSDGQGDGNNLVGLDCVSQTMSIEPYHIQFNSANITPEGLYNYSFDVIGTNYNGYVLINPSNGTVSTFVSGGSDSESSSNNIISSEQVNSIGSAVVQGGTSLVGIGIQLLPYLICFVIILIIFLFIKRISNLKNKPLQ